MVWVVYICSRNQNSVDMTKEEMLLLAKENLCYYDKRNPDYPADYCDEEITVEEKAECFCDNCFYGRTALAECIIQVCS